MEVVQRRGILCQLRCQARLRRQRAQCGVKGFCGCHRSWLLRPAETVLERPTPRRQFTLRSSAIAQKCQLCAQALEKRRYLRTARKSRQRKAHLSVCRLVGKALFGRRLGSRPRTAQHGLRSGRPGWPERRGARAGRLRCAGWRRGAPVKARTPAAGRWRRAVRAAAAPEAESQRRVTAGRWRLSRRWRQQQLASCACPTRRSGASGFGATAGRVPVR